MARSLVRVADDTAVDTVVARIKEMFEQGNLKIGSTLPSERELCEICSASRATVREAMRILKAYGVVEVRPKSGAVIVDRRMETVFELFSFTTLEVSRKTFLDTQGFRQLIEVGCFDELVDRVTAADILELKTINDLMHATGSSHAAALEDFRFHATMVGILGNDQLNQLYRLTKPIIVNVMETVVIRGKFVETNHRQHAGIITALERRDRLSFQYRVAEHLSAGRYLFAEETSPTMASAAPVRRP
jgi:DNA-binding FadR family transcriptional regulator